VHNSNHCSGDPLIPTVKGMPTTSYVGCMRHAGISTQDKTRCYIELKTLLLLLLQLLRFVKHVADITEVLENCSFA